MRTIRLARAAATAEALRWRFKLRRMVIMAVLATIAAVFLLAALAVAHVVAFLALGRHMPPLQAALVILVADVVAAIAFGLIAVAIPAGKERQAEALRNQAAHELIHGFDAMRMAGPIARLFGRKGIYGIIAATLASQFFSGRKA